MAACSDLSSHYFLGTGGVERSDGMARVDDLPWRSLAEAHAAAAKFLDPVLGGESGVWDAERWLWR